MRDQILYSIIVPIYGVEKYLTQCIESLINQTYQNIEIILVDDGSKDNCAQICDYYATLEKKIKVIHKKNGGLVSARKAGARIASGDYIFCVDGDDWVSHKYIECFDDVISKFRPDVVCCSYIQSDGVVEKKHSFEISGGYYNQKKMKEMIYPISIESEYGVIFPPQLWAKAFKKDLYLVEQLSVIDLIKIGEDGAVVKPILTRAKNLYIIDDCLYFYRYNNESMTKNKSAYDLHGPQYIYKHLRERIDLKYLDFEDQIIRRTVKDIYTVVFSQFNRKEKYSYIKKEVKKYLLTTDNKEVLMRCKYKGIKNNLQLFLLKNRILLPIYLFHKLL